MKMYSFIIQLLFHFDPIRSTNTPQPPLRGTLFNMYRYMIKEAAATTSGGTFQTNMLCVLKVNLPINNSAIFLLLLLLI